MAGTTANKIFDYKLYLISLDIGKNIIFYIADLNFRLVENIHLEKLKTNEVKFDIFF